MTINSQIQSLLPDGFSQEAQETIIAMVLETYSETSDLRKQIEAVVELFEGEYPALAVCPRCEGCGCSYCEFDGVYDPIEKEPDGTK